MEEEIDRGVRVLKGKGLREIIAPLKAEQRDFLFLRLLGLKVNKALLKVDRSQGGLEKWRMANIRGFDEIEEYLEENREEYIEEIAERYGKMVRARAILALAQLGERALDWEKVAEKDKRYVFGALQELKRLGSEKGNSSGGESYEEIILKRHRKLEPKEAGGADEVKEGKLLEVGLAERTEADSERDSEEDEVIEDSVIERWKREEGK